MNTFTELSAFHFLRPELMLCLLVVLGVMLILKKKDDRGRQSFVGLAEHLRRVLIIPGDAHSLVNPRNLWGLISVLAVVAAAGPSWEREKSPLSQDKSALVVAIDMSNSMTQDDVQPSRVERAKQKVSDLLALRGDARTSLIAYAGSAHQVIPLSNDADIVKQFLASISPSIMPESGRLPEAVIPIVEQILGADDTAASVLLIADGLSAKTTALFEGYFSRTPHQLIVLGIGSSETDVPMNSSGRTDSNFSPLQERELSALADKVSGYYLRHTIDKTDVALINRMIDHHLDVAEDSNRPWRDMGYLLLLPICLLVLLSFRRGWVLSLAYIFVLSVTDLAFEMIDESAPVFGVAMAATAVEPQDTLSTGLTAQISGGAEAVNLSQDGLRGWKEDIARISNHLRQSFIDLWFTRDQQGRWYFEKQEYRRAASLFENPMWRGIAYYYDEQFSAAEKAFALLDDKYARFNQANSLAQDQHYVQALKVYESLIKVHPKFSAAINNATRLKTLIEEINQMSAKQRAEAGVATRELGEGPQRADGAEQEDLSSDQVEQFTAEQLLANEQIHEMWMRQVQADPAKFLQAKFIIQQARRKSDLEDYNE